jgi:hypothetical protein
MTSCTYDMPRSACSIALETYHGASTIILRILDWLLWGDCLCPQVKLTQLTPFNRASPNLTGHVTC